MQNRSLKRREAQHVIAKSQVAMPLVKHPQALHVTLHSSQVCRRFAVVNRRVDVRTHHYKCLHAVAVAM